MMKNISHFFNNYKIQTSLINENESFKQTIVNMLQTLFINAVIYLIPSLLLINFLIFDRLAILIYILINVLIVSFIITYNLVYVKLFKLRLKKYEDRSFKEMIVLDSLLFSIVLIIALAIGTIIGAR